MRVSASNLISVAHASIRRSNVFEVNNMVVSGKNDSIHRAGTVMIFEFIVRDKVREIFTKSCLVWQLERLGVR